MSFRLVTFAILLLLRAEFIFPSIPLFQVGPGASEKVAPPAINKPVIKNEVTSEAIGTKQERRERKRKLNVVELFHPKKRLRLDPEASSSKPSSEVEKGKKAEKGKKRKENCNNVNDGDDNEGEKSYVNVETSGALQESVQGSEIVDTLEERKVRVDAVGRQKKKIGARSKGGRLCVVWFVSVDSVEYMKGALDVILLCANLRCR